MQAHTRVNNQFTAAGTSLVSTAAVRIDLSAAPHRVDDLLRFLRMTGYVAREVDCAIIEMDADAPPDRSFGVAQMELALRLRVWNEVNGVEARLVEPE